MQNFEYGKNTELEAKMWYQNLKQKNVTSFVLVVISNASFMGCSPGGCIIDESLLIEIKCPILGKKLHIVEVLTKLPYLTKTDNGYQLKLKNAYYGQVQTAVKHGNIKFKKMWFNIIFEIFQI